MPDPCEGNFDNDGDVDGSDLAVFAADFGRTDCDTGPACEGDFDHDGDVDGSDLAVFAADFGRTDCPHQLVAHGSQVIELSEFIRKKGNGKSKDGGDQNDCRILVEIRFRQAVSRKACGVNREKGKEIRR